MTAPKPRRRYLQFSLRTFLVLLTLVCVWFGWQVNRVNRQRKAVAWVLQMGGSVLYDYQYDGNLISYAKPTGPEWLLDFNHQVVLVELAYAPVSDLAPLTKLKILQALDISNTQANDLTPLANLKSLKWLFLANTPVGEEQITKLQHALPNCIIQK